MPATHAKTPPIRRQFPFSQVKMLNEAEGTFSGYLAVYNNEDQGADIIDSGASSKTLSEAKALQTKRLNQGAPSGRYIWPIFWGHDDKNPVGGFTQAREDANGLYVEAELDLDIEEGRRAFSGVKKGYVSGLSIGYFATKYHYDRKGARHLTEIAIFEGSLTPIPMNLEAIVGEVKSATGKADWPLGDRNAAWDNGAAHKRIVDWATDSDGNVDTSKLKSVHFYSPDGDAAENISAYKLLFCDVNDGKVEAMPRAIMACWGAHGVDNTKGISADEKETIHGKLSAYAARMRKEFDDDSIMPPWDAEKKGYRMPTDRQYRKARDFSTHFQALAESDQLQDDWADTFVAIVRCFNDLMWQSQAQTHGWMPDGADNVDIAQAAQDNLDAFRTAVLNLVTRSIAADFVPGMDDDGDSFYDPDGDDDDCNTMYMSRDTSAADTKAGRMMSAANHSELGGMISDMGKSLKAMTASHKALQAYHAKMDPSSTKPGADSQDGIGDTTSGDTGASSNGKDGKAMQPPTDTGAGRHGDDTTPSDAAPLTKEDVQRLIREKMQAQALAQRVGAQQTA